jgi:hypothetical protein
MVNSQYTVSKHQEFSSNEQKFQRKCTISIIIQKQSCDAHMFTCHALEMPSVILPHGDDTTVQATLIYNHGQMEFLQVPEHYILLLDGAAAIS